MTAQAEAAVLPPAPHPDLAAAFPLDRVPAPPPDTVLAPLAREWAAGGAIATRKAPGVALTALAATYPALVGGSARQVLRRARTDGAS